MLEKVISITNIIDIVKDGIIYKDNTASIDKVLFD